MHIGCNLFVKTSMRMYSHATKLPIKPFIYIELLCVEIHGDILRHLLIPPPKGQVAGSNPARDTILTNDLPGFK